MQAFEEAVHHLAARGAVISHATPPEGQLAMDLGTPLFGPEAYGLWRAQIDVAPEMLGAFTLNRFRSGAAMTAMEFVERWADLRRARLAWAEAVAGMDAVILPSVASLPPPIARVADDADAFVAENILALRNTRFANVLGLPAVTLPTGRPACGIMLMGAGGRDRALLRIAAAVEAALRDHG